MKTISRKIDFLGDWIAEPPAYIFAIIRNLTFTPFIGIKIFKKQFLALKKKFLEADFLFLT